jgi:hypothetical protein
VVGIAAWDSIDRDDPVTAYVLDDGVHHMRESRDAAAEASSNQVLLGWLVDQPQDALVHHVGKALGEETLVSAAEAAEAAGEMWQASCRWAVAAKVVKYSKGIPAAVEILKRAADTLLKVDLGARASRHKDKLELAVVNDLIMYDMLSITALIPRAQALRATDCGKAHPAESFAMMWMSETIAPFCTGDFAAMSQTLNDCVSFLVRAGCEGSPDPATQDLCCVLLMLPAGFVPDIMLLSPSFSWDVFGEGEQHCLRCLEAYEYTKHHFKLLDVGNQE